MNPPLININLRANSDRRLLDSSVLHSFAEGLKNNTNLKSLNLQNNIITGNLHILVEALYENTTLNTLILNNSQILDKDIISFCGLLLMDNCKITSVDVGNNFSFLYL